MQLGEYIYRGQTSGCAFGRVGVRGRIGTPAIAVNDSSTALEISLIGADQ
jgi:hypothetical protein